MKVEPGELEIINYHPQDGDVLIFKIPSDYFQTDTQEHAEALVKRVCGEKVRALVIDDKTDVSVLRIPQD